MLEFSKNAVEKILLWLDQRGQLFPQFRLKQINNELVFIDRGGFSLIYEMTNVNRPEQSYALKVTGFQSHTVTSTEFWNTRRLQWILSQESEHIVRVLEGLELAVRIDADYNVTEVKNVSKERWEEEGDYTYLQFVLMEKLERIIEKDRFANVTLLREGLNTEKEVIKLAFQIGQAISTAHRNKCMHRDIKLENILWDSDTGYYKLCDFGTARWSEDGSADTVFFTEGYCAPEIRRRVNVHYNSTVDIYSFGISLYVLLNELRFPGSEEYSPREALQYDSEYVFPAPVNASEKMAAIIRKMCMYYAKDRYQSIDEVMADLSKLVANAGCDKNGEQSIYEELLEMADVATVRYVKETVNSFEDDFEDDFDDSFDKDDEEDEGDDADEDDEDDSYNEYLAYLHDEKSLSRFRRKEIAKLVDYVYRQDFIKYLIWLTAILFLTINGMQKAQSITPNLLLYILPGTLIFEAILQKEKELNWSFAVVVAFLTAFSVYQKGLTFVHLLCFVVLLADSSGLTLAAAFSMILWLVATRFGWNVLGILYKWDAGWFLMAISGVSFYKFFTMRVGWNKVSGQRKKVGDFIYDKIFLVMIIIGFVLFILKKFELITLSECIERLHLVRCGFVSFIAVVFFAWKDGYLEDEEQYMD